MRRGCNAAARVMRGIVAPCIRAPCILAACMLAACAAAALLPGAARAADSMVVGGKIFTEGYVLGEIAAQTMESSSKVPVVRKLGMGSTGILFEALKSGAIDVYSDYTGTLAEAILKRPDLKSLDEIRAALGALDLTISGSLGFNDTYALAVKETFAEQHAAAHHRGLDSHSIGGARGLQLRIHGSQGWLSRVGGQLSPGAAMRRRSAAWNIP